MSNNEKYMFPKKSELIKLTIEQIDAELPDLKNNSEAKSVIIGKWLGKWINSALKNNKITINSILPSKAEFAYHLGVSVGTMQNTFRYLEDLGYVESKQCIGTIIKDKKSSMRKLVSKKDLAVDEIKRYILSGGFSVGSKLPSSRTVATIIGYSANTTRIALENLVSLGIISRKNCNSKNCSWSVLTTDFEVSSNTQTTTLVEMVVKDLENYISNNLKQGDKIPPHSELATSLKASIKTVHDALKILIDKKILLARRGRYGTIVLKMPNSKISSQKPEMSIFASAQETAFYHYEKTQNHIKKLIAQEYEVGDKLPSILELSKTLDLSPNTIRKAFHNLAKEGYLVFSRGRYGGTFVIDIPEVEQQTFKWLAVNPAYSKTFEVQN